MSAPNFHTVEEGGALSPGIAYGPDDSGRQLPGLYLSAKPGAQNPRTVAGRVLRGCVTNLGLAGPCGYSRCEAANTDDPGLWCEVIYARKGSPQQGPFFILDRSVSVGRLASSSLIDPNLFKGPRPIEVAYVDRELLVVGSRAYFLDGLRRFKSCPLEDFLRAVRSASHPLRAKLQTTDESLRALGELVAHPPPAP